MGSLGDLGACSRRSWPDPPGVGRRGLFGVFPCRCGCVDFQQGGTGRALGDGPLFVVARGACETDGLDREGCLHAGGGRPTDAYAGFCGQLLLDWYFCEAKDPQAKGVVERLQGYLETNFEPGRRFANHLDFQLQLDAWFEKANARTHRAIKARPIATGSQRSAGGCGHYRRSRPMSTGIGCCGWRPTRICASTPTTTRLIPASLGGESKSTPPNTRSLPPSWTPASWRVVTNGASPSTAPSLLWSTPGS